MVKHLSQDARMYVDESSCKRNSSSKEAGRPLIGSDEMSLPNVKHRWTKDICSHLLAKKGCSLYTRHDM